VTSHAAPSRARLALIASAAEWLARALESVLQAEGYGVLRASSGAEAVERAGSGRLDAVLVAGDLPDLEGAAVCRALREQALITPSTPVILLTSAPATRERRLAGLRAGAWDHLGLPLDAGELVLKLDAYLRAKGDADGAREQGLVDYESGLYSARGLERHARQLVADASRRHAALACVVLSAEPGPGAAPGAAGSALVVEHVARVLHGHGRASDAIGRWGQTEFAILAPATDGAGAVRLAGRLARVAAAALPPAGVKLPRFAICAGYEAVSDAHARPLEPGDFLAHASAALGQARAAQGERVRSYQGGAG